jgi:hypothetical protein
MQKTDVNFFKLPTEGAVFGYLKFIYVFERVWASALLVRFILLIKSLDGSRMHNYVLGVY